jgi:hypothetical protein
MQACPIRRGPSSSSLSADPQGGRQAPLTMVERRGQGMGELGATREEAKAFASWRGPLASE